MKEAGTSMRSEARTRLSAAWLGAGAWRRRLASPGPAGGALVIALAATPTSAQTLVGRILEEGRDDRPVPEATVALVDREGNRRARVVADSLGRYRLAPPEAGEYVVEVTRIGYESTRSPLLALAVEGSAPFDLLMRPSPVGLEGFEVTVEEPPDEVAKRLLGPFGLTPEILDERWIDRYELDAMTTPGTTGDMIRWAGVPRVYVVPPTGATSPLNWPLCIRYRRGSTEGCAITLFNGVRIDGITANNLNPRELEGIAILTPEEAATFYGTAGGFGAVLMWTREWRPPGR